MSETGMVLFGGKLPAYLQGVEMDATTKALAGGGAGGRRISIRGAVFRMIVDGKQVAENEDRAMNVVIVAAAPSVNRQFYEGTYEEGVATPPSCFSSDGKTPDKDTEHPQSATCAACPQNISGSGQGDSRACRYQQRLAVVLEGEMSGPVYQLALPATSLFGKGEANATKLPLQAYARYLAANGLPITSVVTEMRFDTKSATPKLTFKALRPLTAEEYAVAQEQGQSAEAQQAIALTVFKQDTKEAAPASKAALKRAEVAEATATEVAEAEPKKAPKAKAEAPAGKKPIGDIIKDWDDE